MRGLTGALICLVSVAQMGLAQEVKNFKLEAVVDDSEASVESNFELKDHQGKTVVLHFLLKTECPFCLRYTNQYAKLASLNSDVVHLFIKPDAKRDILAWMKHLTKDDQEKLPTIYQDPDAKLAKEYGIPDGYMFHGENVHYPAMIVLNGDGEEMFRYVGTSNRDRMTTEDFVKKLESLTGK